MYIVVSK